MSTSSSLVVIPDSLLAKEATDILREHSTELLFNHSMRVYLFAAEQGRQQKLRFDPELLYVAAAFHDFGLIKKFSSPNERFEVDGANAARQFLTAHNGPEEQIQTAWQAIALHVLVQRQLEKVRVAANEWVLFWLRLVLRVSLAWRSFWSRAAKMASSLPASLSAGVM